MKFVFFDKNKLEMDVITSILQQENISFKIKRELKPVPCDEHCEDDCENCEGVFIEVYKIMAYTSLEYFDFIKSLSKKEIDKINMLNRCYFKPAAKRAKKQRVVTE